MLLVLFTEPLIFPTRQNSHQHLMNFKRYLLRDMQLSSILDLQFSHVGGTMQKNILSVLLLALADVGEQHCLANLKRILKVDFVRDGRYSLIINSNSHCTRIDWIVAVIIILI